MTYLATGLLVVIGGGLGAVGRYLVAEALRARRAVLGEPQLPLATLLVNLGGSFLLGLVAGLAELGSAGGPGGLALVGIGFCGALTTFSAFALDLVILAERRLWLVLGQYLVASLVGGLALAWLGLEIAARFG